MKDVKKRQLELWDEYLRLDNEYQDILKIHDEKIEVANQLRLRAFETWNEYKRQNG